MYSLDWTKTRMHSSRMCTAHSLTVSPYLVVSHACPPWSNHACPPEQPCTPQATHVCPPSKHAPPQATMHAPRERPCMPHPRSNHTHTPREQPCTPPWEQPCMPPQEQPCMPPLWTEWQTGVKILPCPNFIVGGNYLISSLSCGPPLFYHEYLLFHNVIPSMIDDWWC